MSSGLFGSPLILGAWGKLPLYSSELGEAHGNYSPLSTSCGELLCTKSMCWVSFVISQVGCEQAEYSKVAGDGKLIMLEFSFRLLLMVLIVERNLLAIAYTCIPRYVRDWDLELRLWFQCIIYA